MTTFPEIDLPNALAEYAKNNSVDLSEDNCWILPTGERTGYTDLTGVQWTHETVPAPNEAQLITIYDTWLAAHTATVAHTATIETAQSGLLDKVALAEQYAADIKTLYNAVLDQTENQTVQPTRFNNLYAVVQAAPVALRNRVVTDIQEELGFNVTGSLSAAQQRQACLYLRVFATQLATLLMARKLLSG